MAERALRRMGIDEFLDWEARQDPKYELVDGRPVMMTGGTRAHGDIRGAVYSLFRAGLRGRACRAHIDMKVICENGNVRYPDAQIDCGPVRPSDVQAARPVVVVEVVSPSSQVTDYVAKVRDYATVESISTYLILRQDAVQATVLRRAGDRLDLEAVLEAPDDEVVLPEAGISLRLGDIYEGTGVEPAAADATGW